jgi:vacuolar-type H+-ATPase subunit I/STV1
MKLAVIIGVTHMLFGVVLKGVNAIGALGLVWPTAIIKT